MPVGLCCENCRFCVTDWHAPEYRERECRRLPPQIDSRSLRAIWPIVDADKWCGSYEMGRKPAPTELEEEIPF